MSNFSLRVEDFGKIGSAEIEPSDLTLFIGDNNSGKSYMMTLLYGLLSKPFQDLFLKYKQLAAKRFIPIAEAGLSGKIERLRLGPDEFKLLETTVNEVLV